MAARWTAALCALLLMNGATAMAQEPQTEPAQQAEPAESQPDPVRDFLDSLAFRGGEIAIEGANARLRLDEQFQFLDQKDARRVLEDFWGNFPDESVLGLLVPTAVPLDAEHGSWAVVITYSDEGYVSDEDAAAIDYDALLAEMKEGTEAENEMRQEAGFGRVDLIGWAAPPRYDAQSKKLYWAKELRFDGNPGNTLNYDVRVLGRSGYLSLNAVAGAEALPAVHDGMQQVLALTEFDEGHRYADFNPATDRMAAYGVAALVGGALASKAGLFAKLGALLLAGKKLIIPLLIGGLALVGGWIKRKKTTRAA